MGTLVWSISRFRHDAVRESLRNAINFCSIIVYLFVQWRSSGNRKRSIANGEWPELPEYIYGLECELSIAARQRHWFQLWCDRNWAVDVWNKGKVLRWALFIRGVVSTDFVNIFCFQILVNLSPGFPYAGIVENMDFDMCVVSRKDMFLFRQLLNASNIPSTCPISPGIYSIRNFRLDLNRYPLTLRGFDVVASFQVHNENRILSKFNARCALK